MAPRPIWRGHLRLALVTCPVALYNARHDRAAIRFNMINPKTGNRIKMTTQDSETGEDLSRGDLVKGYEYSKNAFIILTEDELNSVKVESSDVMNVEKFVETSSIDPVYYDAGYFMGPDGRAGEEVYAVLREAIAKTGMTALSRIVMHQRERTIALRPFGPGLIAHTLHEDRDLNSSEDLFRDIREFKLDPQMIDLAKMLIARQSGKYDPSEIEDRYETRLRALLDAKIAGLPPAQSARAPVSDTNVINLMDALRNSLAQEARNETPEVSVPVKQAKTRTKDPVRNQPGLKLPIKGGKDASAVAEEPPVTQPAAPAAKPSRKRA